MPQGARRPAIGVCVIGIKCGGAGHYWATSRTQCGTKRIEHTCDGSNRRWRTIDNRAYCNSYGYWWRNSTGWCKCDRPASSKRDHGSHFPTVTSFGNVQVYRCEPNSCGGYDLQWTVPGPIETIASFVDFERLSLKRQLLLSLAIFDWSNYSRQVVYDIACNALTFEQSDISLGAFCYGPEEHVRHLVPQFVVPCAEAPTEPILLLTRRQSLIGVRYGKSTSHEILDWIRARLSVVPESER